jgi:hypothetical protein
MQLYEPEITMHLYDQKLLCTGSEITMHLYAPDNRASAAAHRHKAVPETQSSNPETTTSSEWPNSGTLNPALVLLLR